MWKSLEQATGPNIIPIYKSNLPWGAGPFPPCFLRCAHSISSNKKLCLSKSLEEAIFISTVLLSKNLERAVHRLMKVCSRLEGKAKGIRYQIPGARPGWGGVSVCPGGALRGGRSLGRRTCPGGAPRVPKGSRSRGWRRGEASRVES